MNRDLVMDKVLEAWWHRFKGSKHGPDLTTPIKTLKDAVILQSARARRLYEEIIERRAV